MKLIFIHGAPASGKLTIAKALLRIVPGRLFDNHVAIDFVRTIFEFGVPGFWELVHDVRLSAFEAAAQQDVPLVVTTYVYSEPHDRAKFEQFDAVVQRHGGELLPVFLHTAEDEIVKRVGNAERGRRRKITSVEGLNRFRSDNNIVPVPKPNCMMLDTATVTPNAAAQAIVAHFGLAKS